MDRHSTADEHLLALVKIPKGSRNKYEWDPVSEHIVLVHAHDNRGRSDDHLVPFDGSIDWPAAMTALQKVGYDGPVILEISANGSPKETLVRARAAAERFERLLADSWVDQEQWNDRP